MQGRNAAGDWLVLNVNAHVHVAVAVKVHD
jgi:hypothetical protein